MNPKIFVFLTFIILFTSCHTNKELNNLEHNNLEQQETSLSEKKSDIIVFLSFSIQRQNNVTTIQLIEKKESKGHLKPQNNYLKNDKALLNISFYHQDELLETKTIEHPLQSTIEHLNENTDGLQLSTVSSDNSTFYLRAQYDKSITHIQFKEVLDGKSSPLNSIKL